MEIIMLVELYSNYTHLDNRIQVAILMAIACVSAFMVGRFIPRIIRALLSWSISPEFGAQSEEIIGSYKRYIAIVFALFCIEIIISIRPFFNNYPTIEVINSVTLTIGATWLCSRLFGTFFDNYLLDTTVKSGRKSNSELLIFAKLVANILLVIIAILLFAQTHHINVISILASLGIGGLAVAFAAQKTLEQLLGGIVLYLDQPFKIDDYIGLPDGNFGRVESIGWRSTKIRTSGKGTVMIIPNSSLTQMNIENFSGAKKVLSILYLNFYRIIEPKEQALIKQVVLASTNDIFGLESGSTDITFKSIDNSSQKKRNQAQVTFFILGSGKVSMELRRQLLDIAKQNIEFKLKEYGIAFDIDEPTIYVDAPITI